MSDHDLSMRWARRLVSGLADAGARDVVVSPGSRSTPLVLALAAEERLRTHVLVDERAAAFFALGMCRATGRPVIVVCTSGTAGAHYLPAVIEAGQAHLPLVIVTADRPMELRDCAASQTIDQLKMFGGHVRRFFELGAPDASPAALQAVARVAAQAVLAAEWPTPGAVHVNAAFRKPLEPSDTAWRDDASPAAAPAFFAPLAAPAPDAIDLVARAIVGSQRGVLAVGAMPPGVNAEAIHALAAHVGPLFADTASQLRRSSATSLAAPGFDTFLSAAPFARVHEPDLVLELGMPLLSPSYAAWLALHPDCRRLVVAPYGWTDPLGGAEAMIFADPAALAREVCARLPGGPGPGEAAWRDAFGAADAAVWQEVERSLAGHDVLLEGSVARAVLAALPEGAVLSLGASAPLRDVDRFSRGPSASVSVLAPRGANGIDGGVAGAAGAHAATGRPTVLLAGDVALLHDLGSLVVAAQARGPLVLVVVHNDGGHIFDELPLAGAISPELLARLFTTPHGLSFGSAATFAGLAHARVTTPAALASALDAGLARSGATLIEAVTPAAASSSCRRQIRAAVAERLGPAGRAGAKGESS